MMIIALVLAAIGLAALVFAVVTSNALVAWVCIGASILGVLLLIVDAVRERRRQGKPVEASDDPEDAEEADDPDDAEYRDDPDDPDDPEGQDAAVDAQTHEVSAAVNDEEHAGGEEPAELSAD